MATTYADRKFSYNPFASNQVIRDEWGTPLFYKDPKTEKWMQGTENPRYGDQDFSPPSYSWSEYAGTPAGTPEWEYGVNWQDLEKNNPELAAAWGQNSTGFLRDSTGFNHFKVIGYDPKTGTYTTMTKTGDKEGTVEQWGQGKDGSWGVVKNFGAQPWDTNRNVTDQGAFNVAKIVAAPLIAYGANELLQGSGLLSNAATATETASSGSGSFLSDLLGQSFANGPSLGAAQSAAPSFLANAAASSTAPLSLAPWLGTSEAALAALGPVAATTASSMPDFSNVKSGVTSTAPISASSVPGAVTAAKAAGAAAASPLLQKAADALGIDAGLLGDALKIGGPLLGGALTAWEASQQNGKENPQDVWTRDWARNRLSNPKPMPSPVTGPYREQMTGLLGQAPSDTIQQLKAKRYY